MQNFELKGKTNIYFGNEVLEHALQVEKEKIRGNILIVTTGGSLVRHGYLKHLQDTIREYTNASQVMVYDNVSRNPKLEEVAEAVKMGIASKTDIVIGFGGGSAIDAAKATAVGIPIKADVAALEDYLICAKEPGINTLPIIAIPTTAGTGSELSRAAILTSKKMKIKGGIRGDNIIPTIAIVDSMYTWTVPEKITMETGFDVLAHAIESYVAKKADPFSEMLSEKVIEICGRCLRAFKNDLDDHQAREKMSFASMLMGMNLARIGTCLPHRLQYPVGIITESSHGAGLAALYPAWLKQEYEVNPDKVAHIYELLQLDTRDLNCFKQEIGIDITLEKLGICEKNLNEIVQQTTGKLENDPAYAGEETLYKILRDSL